MYSCTDATSRASTISRLPLVPCQQNQRQQHFMLPSSSSSSSSRRRTVRSIARLARCRQLILWQALMKRRQYDQIALLKCYLLRHYKSPAAAMHAPKVQQYNTIQYNNSICRALFTKRPGALTETSSQMWTQLLTYLHNLRCNVNFRQRRQIYLRCKLRPNRCRYRQGYNWQPIGTHQRSIQRYHRRPSTAYRLATIRNVTDDRQTDDRSYHKRDRWYSRLKT